MQRQTLRELLAKRILVSDGATGTLLQTMGALPAGSCLELFNLTQPDLVQSVHTRYLQVGCDLLQTNTFGANPLRLNDYGLADKALEINQRGVAIARRAASDYANVLVAGDIGSSGRLLFPLGPLGFEQATEAYYRQAKALVSAGVDLLLIETMTDLHEAKAAVVAAKAASNSLPVICSLTYNPDWRTLTGADPETVVTVLEALGVDVVGVNCGFGPDGMGTILSRQRAVSACPLLVQPNAGLPRWQEGRSIFSLCPTDMASYVGDLVQAGANIIGGCCGTTPEHVRLLAEQARKLQPLARVQPQFSKLAGGTETVIISDYLPTRVVGERINPTARRQLAQALRQHDFSVVANEAIKQVEAGASLVDVNMGIRVPNASEGDLLQSAVLAVQRVTGCPLSIDTVHYQAMRQALTVCRGKPLLNSANGDEDNLEQVTDLAAKYGAALVGLTLDSRGLPTTARERVQIARRIVERALAKGVAREDIYIDGLTLTAGASQAQLLETLHTIQLVKSELGVRTVLGVSNISHGLPERAMLNNAFLAMALGSGLDLPIVNPAQTGLWSVISAADVITNRDQHAAAYLSRASLKTTDQTSVKQQNAPAGLPSEQQLLADILSGERTRLETLTNTLLGQGESAMDLINHIVIPAMEEAGRRYDQHRFFLPQLLLAAEAAQVTFSLLHPLLCQTTEAARGTIVLATVKGDIHDIGKNIVGLLLSNHGFRVIDLGKDVSSELIINTACQEQADLIALSALMTTTMPEMGVVAQKLKQRQLQIPLLVGGAAVSADFAASIGAHYAADATLAVEQAKSLVRRTTDGSGSLSCTS